jgi:farnesyl-diphosphate farnesyltransferase
MNLYHDALDTLKQTSRTFYIPISRLPTGLKEAVASAYLCMRAIDEVEDHANLDNRIKAERLRQISMALQAGPEKRVFDDLSSSLQADSYPLEEVTMRVGEWALLAPPEIAPRIWDATAAMADRMAYWADCNWQINTKADLDHYTFSVAGAVGLLLSDLWAWYDGTQTNRVHAIGFGRGLQSVNILRNAGEDGERGVNYFPQGWTTTDMDSYARYNLALADAYTNSLPKGPARDFCCIPLTLAYATLDTMASGKDKLTRTAVMQLVEQVIGSKR